MAKKISVYDMTTKQYMNWLSRNRITKEMVCESLVFIEIDFTEEDRKLTTKQLIEKYGEDLKDAVLECCFE